MIFLCIFQVIGFASEFLNVNNKTKEKPSMVLKTLI